MSYESQRLYLSDVWNRTIENITNQGKIPAYEVQEFIAPSVLIEVNQTKAIIETPNIIYKQVLSNNMDFKSAIQTGLETVLNMDHPLMLEFLMSDEIKKLVVDKQQEPEPARIDYNDPLFESEPLNSERTFENFVVGDSNRECRSAALACACNLGQFFNPLFIYGNSGLGKTHLMHAIGNYVLSKDPTKKVYYTDSIKFVEKVVEAIKVGKIDAFKEYMCSLDVLLVDDIQFLAGKEKSHEVFFTIFNDLVNNKKQICIVSDRIPQEIKGLEERLISRFSSGLSVGIDSPEFETSLAILKMKLMTSGYDIESISDEGLAFMASNFNRDVRSLEGALNRVLFYGIQFQNDGGQITAETCYSALKGQAVVSDKTGLSPARIIRGVADYYGLTKQQLTSKTRTKNVANARHIAIYLTRKMLDLPYNIIGREFGGRDHSTIISACEKVEKQMKTSETFRLAIKEIEKSIA